MIRRTIIAAGILFLPLQGQEILSSRIKWMRIYGQGESQLPVASLSSSPITIEFDMNDEYAARLGLRFIHCDRDWKRTATSFVNDSPRMKSKSELVPEAAPGGVQHYRLHYTINVPGYPVFDEFFFSGNYLFELWDTEQEVLLARGQFFVAEDLVSPLVRVVNRQEPDAVNPYYQVHKVGASFSVPSSDSSVTMTYYSSLFTTVDVYKNREISRPRRIDLNDQSPHTFIEGFGLDNLTFIVDDVLPGNEYRVLDIRNVDEYPAGSRHRPRSGADLSRFLLKAKSDNNGGSAIVRGNRYADYVDFQFELLWDPKRGDSIFVAGDFNGWQPEGPLVPAGNRYRWSRWIRRGVYDYQYILNGDWIALEGNELRTTNNYTAFVYYRDPRFGGFDRIVGVGRANSPGTQESP